MRPLRLFAAAFVVLTLAACPRPVEEPLPLEITTAALPDGYRGEAYAAEWTATGGVPPYTWTRSGTSTPDGLTLRAGGALSGVPLSAGEFSAAVQVVDSRGATATQTLPLRIHEPVSFVTEALAVAVIGEPYEQPIFAGGGVAPLQLTLTTALPDGLSFSAGVLSGTPTVTGEFPVTFSAVDANDRAATRSYSLAVRAPIAFEPVAPAPAYAGEPYALSLTVSGGAAPYAFTVSDGTLPAGLSLAAGGELAGTPTTPGDYTFTVRVTDAAIRTATRMLTLRVLAPVQLLTAALTDGYRTRAYSGSLQAAGGEAPYSFALVGGTLPAGLSMTSAGAVSGNPTEVTASVQLEVRVTDARGRTASGPVTLAVFDPPSLTAALSDAYVGVSSTHPAVGSGGKAPLQWVVESGALPAGMSLAAGTGLITGVPSAEGVATFTLRLQDANGVSTSTATSLAVYALPSVSEMTPEDAYVTVPFSHQAQTSGGKAPLSYSVTSGTPPPGLSLSTGGELSGTPTAAGSFPITVAVSDANHRTSPRSWNLEVYALPELVTSSLPDGQVGAAYTEQLSVSGGKAPLRYELVGGALPAGVQLDGLTGAFSGTPELAETASFTVRVLDANDRADDQVLAITIAPGSGPAILVVANWNIEWFGSTGLGPSDEALQLQNATGVIADGGFDVVGVAEIVSTAQFNSLVAGLPGYGGFLANDPTVTGGSGSYGVSEQKLGFVYDTAKVTILNREIILAVNDYDFAGRPPLRVDTRVSIDGVTEDVTFIMVHNKAQTGGADDWDRRAGSAAALKGYLDTFLPAANVLVIGDWNDDVDESISCSGGVCLDTPWRNFLDDPTDYTFVTAPLTYAGLQSTVSYDDMIDHHLATNEMNALFFGYPEVVRPDLWPVPVANYGDTTSDHYPILTRYDLSGGGGPPPEPPAQNVFMNEIRYDEPDTSYSAEFIEVRNGGTVNADLSGWTLSDAQVRHVFAPGTILAPGKVIVVFGGASAIGDLLNAVQASSGSLHLLSPADFIDLKRADGSVVDSFSYDSSPGDGISMNRSPDGDEAGIWVSHFTLAGTSASPGVRADGAAW